MANEANEINISDFDMVSFLATDSDDDIADEPINVKRRRKNEVSDKINEIGQVQINKRFSHEATRAIVKLMNGMSNAGISLPEEKKSIRARIYKEIEYKILFTCAHCEEIFENEAKAKATKCSNCDHLFEKDSKQNNFLVYIPLEPQIRRLLDKYFKDIVTYLNREHSDQFMSDIDDGILFKKLSETKSNVKLLTFTLNTDGANIFNSSKDSLWPVQLYANFLPPSIRYLPENIILSTLSYGKKKPNMMNLLYPLARECDFLKEELISFHRDDEFWNFCPVILLCVFDLQARAEIQAMKGPVGKFGCPYCHHPGNPIKNLSGRTTIRHIHRSPQKLRTHSETVTLAKRAPENGGENCGIKGHSAVILFDNIDIINSFPIDFMHNAILGIVKDLIEIWLGKRKIPQPPYKEYMIKSSDSKKILERRIMNLKPYSDFCRKPRSINEVSNYKATELLNCLWYYLRYTLVGILPTRIVKHFEKLSAAIYMLCKKNIDYDEIRTASDLLMEFVKDFDEIYGQGAVTMNVHILTHYQGVVMQCGPLWSYSMFGFESNIGRLKQFVCGKTDVLLQIADKYVESLCEPQNYNREKKIQPHIELKQKTTIAIKQEYSRILENSGNISLGQGSIDIWRSIELKGRLYTSINAIATKSADFFVRVANGNIGTIEFFFGDESNPKFLLHVYRNIFENYHFIEVEQTGSFETFQCEEIIEKLLYFESNRIKYITKEPNVYGRGECTLTNENWF